MTPTSQKWLRNIEWPYQDHLTAVRAHSKIRYNEKYHNATHKINFDWNKIDGRYELVEKETRAGGLMEALIGDVRDIKFEFEPFLKEKLGISLEDDRSTFSVNYLGELCKYFLKINCPKGDNCQFRHAEPKVEKAVVCKHWLRGLCKKGETCEFLHEYNLKKMPECWFFSKYGECSNSECQYLHVDPDSKVKECPWYARGFCKHGQTCRNKHVRKVACQLYLTGFCPFGRGCENVHAKYDLPPLRDEDQRADARNVQAENVICYKCGKKGHFSNRCTNTKKQQRE